MLEAWEFVTRRPELLAEWVLAHLWIIFVAIIAAVILGIILGVYITGKGREQLADTVLYLAEIMMTVPSLALFGLLMLLLGAMGLRAIGFLPAVIALIVYGQLILENKPIYDVEDDLIDQIFDFMVRDFSKFALQIYGEEEEY